MVARIVTSESAGLSWSANSVSEPDDSIRRLVNEIHRQRCLAFKLAQGLERCLVVPAHSRHPSAWTSFEKSGWRGAYRKRIAGSKVRLYLLGALVEELEDATKASIDAWLTHDELALDISQSAVVRGKRLEERVLQLT